MTLMLVKMFNFSNRAIGIISLEFNRRHYELVSKFNVGLKSLLHHGLSEPEFYDVLVYKFKKVMSKTDFSDQLRKMIIR